MPLFLGIVMLAVPRRLSCSLLVYWSAGLNTNLAKINFKFVFAVKSMLDYDTIIVSITC